MPVVWNWRDPKTVELSNTGPAGPSAQPSAQLPVQAEAPGEAPNAYELKRRMLEEYIRKVPPKEKREWRREIKGLALDLEHGGFDSNTRIQELFDTGAIRYEEDGLYSNVKTRLTPEQNEVLVRAADEWADRVGLWRDGQFNPDNYRPYEAEQLKEMRGPKEMNHGSP